MRRHRTLTSIGIMFVALLFVSAAPKKSVVPGKLINVCPGQDCSFGQWRARGEVTVYSQKDVSSEVAFKLVKGDEVTGVSSELVVRKSGSCVVTRPVRAYETITRAPVNLKAGDRISTLYSSAENYMVGNFQKKRIEVCCVGDDLDCKSAPENELWLKVRSESGAVGWTNQRDRFLGTSD